MDELDEAFQYRDWDTVERIIGEQLAEAAERDTSGHDREYWQQYLDTSETYGSTEQRAPEYKLVFHALTMMGLRDDDTILDVGAGSCDFDHIARTWGEWRGRYVPVDGSIDGTDLNNWTPSPDLKPEWAICIETIEHVHEPEILLEKILVLATKGVVFTTPNPEVVDVFAVDPTHVSEVFRETFEKYGLHVESTEFSGRGDHENKNYDTLIASTEKFM